MNVKLIKAVNHPTWLYEIEDSNGYSHIFKQDNEHPTDDILDAAEKWYYRDPKGYWVLANPETPILKWLRDQIS